MIRNSKALIIVAVILKTKYLTIKIRLNTYHHLSRRVTLSKIDLILSLAATQQSKGMIYTYRIFKMMMMMIMMRMRMMTKFSRDNSRTSSKKSYFMTNNQKNLSIYSQVGIKLILLLDLIVKWVGVAMLIVKLLLERVKVF